MYMTKRIPVESSDSLEDYILNSRDELTHIIVDDNPNLPEFLQNVNKNEEEYKYLKKVFDSKNDGFNHQVKIFEINYEKFDFMQSK